MSLLQLPPETLIQIFDCVGSSYFRSDLSRLTVCKQWSKFAYTACFRDFYVTQKTLRRLLSSPYVESSLPLVKDSVETLDLDLKGFEDWDSIPLSRHDSRAVNVLNVSTWNGAHGRAVRASWTTELNNDLLYLGGARHMLRFLHRGVPSTKSGYGEAGASSCGTDSGPNNSEDIDACASKY